MIVIAHMSDIHIDADARSAERTRLVMDYLAGLRTPPDVLLVTGDIADHGLEPEYATVRTLLAGAPCPTLVCPGNHDDRAAFRRVLLGAEPSTAPVDQVWRTGRLVVALADSSVPGADDGLIGEATLAWLDAELARTPAGVPAVIGFHHPPVELGIPYVDGIRQFGEERLAALIRRHPQVAAVLCGHAHTAAATTFAGRPLLVAPGVVSTTRLPWEPRAHPDDHVHLDQPPALAFHILDGGRITTHYRSVVAPER